MRDHERSAGSASPPDRLPKVGGRGQAVARGQHTGRRPSDSEAVAALATTGGQDGATRTGAHPQAESMHLVTATVVRLVRTLAHDFSTRFSVLLMSGEWCCGTCPPVRTTQNVARKANSWRNWHRPPAQRAQYLDLVVDMRHRSNRSRPANGTRRLLAGSIREPHLEHITAKEPMMHARRLRLAPTRRRNTKSCGQQLIHRHPCC